MTQKLLFISLATLCVIATAAITQHSFPTSQYAAVVLSDSSGSTTHLPTSAVNLGGAFPEAPVVKATSTTTPRSTPVTPATPIPKANEPVVDTEALNATTREAIVNIVCISQNSENPISATGVIIDPRGVILTNAHVGQYLLLRDSGNIALTCTVRTGSPASVSWNTSVLYVSSQWVAKHAGEIRQTQALGTGEHDYALLRITGRVSGAPLPASFPYVPQSIGSAAAYTDQQVLVASYPAGFLGGATTLTNLDLVSTITKIKKVFTFGSGSYDLVSLGGIIVAQSGSSGGAVVNMSGKLIAIIATSSLGNQTSERDLHAVTLSHINESILTETGKDLGAYLAGDLNTIEASFNSNTKPALVQALIGALLKKN